MKESPHMGTMVSVTSAPSSRYVTPSAAERPRIKTQTASVRVTMPEGRGRFFVRATFASKSRSQMSLPHWSILSTALLLRMVSIVRENLLPQTKDAMSDLIGSKDAGECTSYQFKRQILLHSVEEKREPCGILLTRNISDQETRKKKNKKKKRLTSNACRR